MSCAKSLQMPLPRGPCQSQSPPLLQLGAYVVVAKAYCASAFVEYAPLHDLTNLGRCEIFT